MSESSQQQDRTPGIVSWNGLCTHDAEASASFYTQLFDWKVETMDMGANGTYTMFHAGRRPAAGLITLPPEAKDGPTIWMGYITVQNLAESVAKARSLGARVCKDITSLPMGSFAVIADPQGAVFGLWEYAADSCEPS
jgi:predicted enzyme related to lactoylglutathione lyase